MPRILVLGTPRQSFYFLNTTISNSDIHLLLTKMNHVNSVNFSVSKTINKTSTSSKKICFLQNCPMVSTSIQLSGSDNLYQGISVLCKNYTAECFCALLAECTVCIETVWSHYVFFVPWNALLIVDDELVRRNLFVVSHVSNFSEPSTEALEKSI